MSVCTLSSQVCNKVMSGRCQVKQCAARQYLKGEFYASQMRTVLSSLPDASCVPSLLYATLLTAPVWPCGKTEGASTTSTLSHLLVRIVHTRASRLVTHSHSVFTVSHQPALLSLPPRLPMLPLFSLAGAYHTSCVLRSPPTNPHALSTHQSNSIFTLF